MVNEMTTPTLPYSFDNSAPVRIIVRGTLGLLFFVLVPGILYSLPISRDRAATALHLPVDERSVLIGSASRLPCHIIGVSGTCRRAVRGG